MTTRTPAPYHLTLTVGLCFLVVLVEELDLQAAGIAAVDIAYVFASDKIQMSWVFSAGTLRLLPDALVDGMLVDRYGRKRILVASVALFGLFSLVAAISWDLSSLVFVRLMIGVGLGAALPNLIALTSEAASPRFRGTMVGLVYCGAPIDVVLATAPGLSGLAFARQTIFWVGGAISLLLVPLLMCWPPKSQVYTQQTQVAVASLWALPTPAMASVTLLLWLRYFSTLLVVCMLINQLPMLLVGQGFRPSQAAGIVFALQTGTASGTLALGALVDKLRPVVMSLLVYTGMSASLLALGIVSSLSGMLMAGSVTGVFATDGQSVSYALAPLFYSTQIRTAGVGTTVTVERLGAMGGPLLAEKMLVLGIGMVGMMTASAPGISLAGLTISILMSRKSQMPFPVNDA